MAISYIKHQFLITQKWVVFLMSKKFMSIFSTTEIWHYLKRIKKYKVLYICIHMSTLIVWERVFDICLNVSFSYDSSIKFLPFNANRAKIPLIFALMDSHFFADFFSSILTLYDVAFKWLNLFKWIQIFSLLKHLIECRCS